MQKCFGEASSTYLLMHFKHIRLTIFPCLLYIPQGFGADKMIFQIMQGWMFSVSNSKAAQVIKDDPFKCNWNVFVGLPKVFSDYLINLHINILCNFFSNIAMLYSTGQVQSIFFKSRHEISFAMTVNPHLISLHIFYLLITKTKVLIQFQVSNLSCVICTNIFQEVETHNPVVDRFLWLLSYGHSFLHQLNPFV